MKYYFKTKSDFINLKECIEICPHNPKYKIGSYGCANRCTVSSQHADCGEDKGWIKCKILTKRARLEKLDKLEV